MGLAASQCRLLSLNSRMSDLELRAQMLSNQKVALSTASSQASSKYINALNSQHLNMYSPDGSYIEATADLLTCKDAYTGSDQLFLQDGLGQLLCSEDILRAYDAADGDLENFLNRFGSTLNTESTKRIPNIASMLSGGIKTLFSTSETARVTNMLDTGVFDYSLVTNGISAATKAVDDMEGQSITHNSPQEFRDSMRDVCNNLRIASCNLETDADGNYIKDENGLYKIKYETDKNGNYIVDSNNKFIPQVLNDDIYSYAQKAEKMYLDETLNTNIYYYDIDEISSDVLENLGKTGSSSINVNGADLLGNSKNSDIYKLANNCSSVVFNYFNESGLSKEELDEIINVSDLASVALYTDVLNNSKTYDVPDWYISGSVYLNANAQSGNLNELVNSDSVFFSGNTYTSDYDSMINKYFAYFNAIMADVVNIDSNYEETAMYVYDEGAFDYNSYYYISNQSDVYETGEYMHVLSPYYETYENNIGNGLATRYQVDVTYGKSEAVHTLKDEVMDELKKYIGAFSTTSTKNTKTRQVNYVRPSYTKDTLDISDEVKKTRYKDNVQISSIPNAEIIKDFRIDTNGEVELKRDTSYDEDLYDPSRPVVQGEKQGFDDFLPDKFYYMLYQQEIKNNVPQYNQDVATNAAYDTTRTYVIDDASEVVDTENDIHTFKLYQHRMVDGVLQYNESTSFNSNYDSSRDYKVDRDNVVVDSETGNRTYNLYQQKMVNGSLQYTNNTTYKNEAYSNLLKMYQFEDLIDYDEATGISTYRILSDIYNFDSYDPADLLFPDSRVLVIGTVTKTPIMEQVGTLTETPDMAEVGTLTKTPKMIQVGTTVEDPIMDNYLDYHYTGANGQNTSAKLLVKTDADGNEYVDGLPEVYGEVTVSYSKEGTTVKELNDSYLSELVVRMQEIGFKYPDDFYEPAEDGNVKLKDFNVLLNMYESKWNANEQSIYDYNQSLASNATVDYSTYAYNEEVGYSEKAFNVYSGHVVNKYQETLYSAIEDFNVDSLTELIENIENSKGENFRAMRDQLYNIKETVMKFLSDASAFFETTYSYTPEIDEIVKKLNVYAAKVSFTNDDIREIRDYLDQIVERSGVPKSCDLKFSNQETIDYYKNLFYAIKNSYRDGKEPISVSRENWNDANWLNNQLTIGNVSLASGENGVLIKKQYNTSFTYLTEDSLSDADLTKAQAEYEAEVNKITRKEKKIDNELALINTEHAAIEKQIETITNTKEDNIKQNFNLFS